MYEGKRKPQSVDVFMGELCDEINKLIIQGVKGIEIQRGLYVMDTPARSLIFQIKNPPGYYSCHKCWIKGVYNCNHRTISFVGVGHKRRTHDEFVNKTQYNEYDKQNSHHLVGNQIAIEKILGKIYVKRNIIIFEKFYFHL